MWITESNRLRHLVYAIPSALVGTLLFALGLGIGMELKDKLYGNKFDWLDLLATIIGGIVGQGLQLLIIYLLMSI